MGERLYCTFDAQGRLLGAFFTHDEAHVLARRVDGRSVGPFWLVDEDPEDREDRLRTRPGKDGMVLVASETPHLAECALVANEDAACSCGSVPPIHHSTAGSLTRRAGGARVAELEAAAVRYVTASDASVYETDYVSPDYQPARTALRALIGATASVSETSGRGADGNVEAPGHAAPRDSSRPLADRGQPEESAPARVPLSSDARTVTENVLWVALNQCEDVSPDKRNACTIEQGHAGAHVAVDPVFNGVLDAWPAKAAPRTNEAKQTEMPNWGIIVGWLNDLAKDSETFNQRQRVALGDAADVLLGLTPDTPRTDKPLHEGSPPSCGNMVVVAKRPLLGGCVLAPGHDGECAPKVALQKGEIHPQWEKMPRAIRLLLNLALEMKGQKRDEEARALHLVLESEAGWKSEAFDRGRRSETAEKPKGSDE